MWAEQAIFTSLDRGGRAGYHLVSRSPGLTDAEANALAAWSPSQGALLVDEANRTSLNFHPLPTGRLALARTCQGGAEYSGRGERQLYTHILILDRSVFIGTRCQPVALYRDALALGRLHYRPDPAAVLEPVELSEIRPAFELEGCLLRASAVGITSLEEIQAKLASGQPVRLHYAGDRITLAECLLGAVDPEQIPNTSFSTSLLPSAVRPFRLVLLPAPGSAAARPGGPGTVRRQGTQIP